mgnify:CR=1 FL=1
MPPRMMQTVIDELPDATIISVAHRAELEAFHSRKITLERREGGAKLVSDIHLIPHKVRSAPCFAHGQAQVSRCGCREALPAYNLRHSKVKEFRPFRCSRLVRRHP